MYNDKRKEYFLIFAKNFSFRIKEAICMDLNDILNFYKIKDLLKISK